MIKQIEQLLPLIANGDISEAGVEEIRNSIRAAIAQDPSRGKELGPLMGLINNALKAQVSTPRIDWLPVGGGFIAIGHKPGGKISYEGLKKAGLTAVLTLLKESEGARSIGEHLEKVNIDWIWFPFSASKPHEGKDISEVVDLYERLAGLLKAGGRIYIHCSAGIHRTGMVTYGLLRYLGMEKMEAMQALRSLREVTATQVGEERLIWADNYFSR